MSDDPVIRPLDEDEPEKPSAPKTPAPEEMLGAMLDADAQPAPLAPPEDFLNDAPESPAPPEDSEPARAPEPSPAAETLPPMRPQLDPRLREVAERFIKMGNQAATYSDMLNNEEISFEEYQRLLYEGMVQDEAGNWWMIDAENEQWYRHDPDSNQWLEDYPTALREWERVRDELAKLRPSAESGTRTETVYDLPPDYRADTDMAEAEPVGDQMGVEIGLMPPTKDELYTIPSTAAFSSELPHQQRTVAADSQEAATRKSKVKVDGGEVIPRAFDADHDYDLEPSPIVRELLASRRARNRRRLMMAVVAILMVALVGAIVAAGGILFWYRDTVAPFQADIAGLANYSPEHQTARIFDANGGLIAAINSRETGARTNVPLDRISPFMIHAIVSQENERFFEDPGFDPIAIVRAFLQNLSGGGIESGASTITQQIARNLVLRDRQITVERKINEILVALEIANQYDKNFILELYLNEIFFANRNYGVEAAAQFYFDHSAADLNYAESALLASIVPSPVQFDPVSNRENAIRGMRSTMGKMLDVGCLQFQHADWIERGPFCILNGGEVDIDGNPQILVRADEAGRIIGGAAIVQIAEIETTTFAPLTVRFRYPHFANYVRALVEEEFGAEALFKRGLNIYTTLDPTLQDVAQRSLSQQVGNLVAAATGVNTGAVMITDPATGAIRAMVGSHDFDDQFAGQVNHALTWQQPGSAMKPIVYAAAFEEEQGSYLTPASIVWDVPASYDMGVAGIYEPVNFDGKFHGPVSLRQALQNSYNVAAVKVYEYVDNIRFSDMAARFGLTFPQDSLVTISSALGANEVTLYDMMGAYGVFANGGKLVPLYAIERVTEMRDGGEVDIERERPEARQVISPALAYLMQNVLSDDNARFPSIRPRSQLTLEHIGIPTQNVVAAKTGTSNGARDLWTMGFTSKSVVGVWLGATDNTPTYNTGGLESAAPLWNAVMTAAALADEPQPFVNPGGVVAREICRATGTLNFPGCPDPSTGLFIHGQYPPPPEESYIQRLAVDSWTGLRANEFCNGNIIEKTFVSVNDAAAIDWLNGSEEGLAFALRLGIDLPVKPMPQASCAQGQALPLIHISAPNDGAVARGRLEIRGQVQAPDFDRYELQYALAADPDTFLPISASLVEMPNYGTVLGVWDPASGQAPNGEVILRLAARSTNGGFINDEIRLTIDLPPALPIPVETESPDPDEAVFSPTIVALPLGTPTP